MLLCADMFLPSVQVQHITTISAHHHHGRIIVLYKKYVGTGGVLLARVTTSSINQSINHHHLWVSHSSCFARKTIDGQSQKSETAF